MSKTKPGAALKLKDARILLAGAASLVGSHTADKLLAAGAREVVLLDNFAFGTPEALAREERLRDGIPIPPRLDTHIRDICGRCGAAYVLQDI